jgi:hypothetical protein
MRSAMTMRPRRGLLCLVAALAACGSSGSSTPSSDAASVHPNNGTVCGDGVCAATEVTSCPQDCGTGGNGSGSNNTTNNPVCGNGICEAGETSVTCPSDCPSSNGNGSGALNCNDENTLVECLACLSANVCTGVTVSGCEVCALGSGLGSGACNFDGVCDPGENASNCPTDCP